MITRRQYVVLMRRLLDQFERSPEFRLSGTRYAGERDCFLVWDQKFHEMKQREVNEMEPDDFEVGA